MTIKDKTTIANNKAYFYVKALAIHNNNPHPHIYRNNSLKNPKQTKESLTQATKLIKITVAITITTHTTTATTTTIAKTNNLYTNNNIKTNTTILMIIMKIILNSN